MILDNNSNRVKGKELIKGNGIQTSKYTWYNFIPKNLMIQFSKSANIFYLFIAFLQMIPLLSITGGKPVMLFPLSQVILISMIKDIFEDSKRHKSDGLENNRQVLLYQRKESSFKLKPWKQVKVGDLVRVRD